MNRWVGFRRDCKQLVGMGLAALAVLIAGPVSDLKAFPSAGATTDSSLKHMSLAQLASVEVTTTSKEPEPVWKTPAAIYVLTQDDIRRSGATSIPEVLRMVPGVQVSRSDTDHWSVGIRGFADQFSKSMLVLVDGRSLYTPLFAGVYWANQDGVMLEDVERIEVIRGPGATVWGANAVNGVINIITKSAKDTHGTLVTTGGGNIDQGILGFRYGGSNGHNFDYRVYGKTFSRGSEFHADGDSYDHWRLGQVGFRSDWNATQRDALTIQGDMYKGGIGQEVAIAVFNPPSELDATDAVAVSGGNLLARWRRQIDDKSDIQIQGYFDRTFALAPHYQETRNTFDFDFIHHLALPWRQDFIWGLGVRLSPSEFVQTVSSLDFLPHDIANNVYSGFVQDEIALVPNRFSLTLGTKLEHNNYTGLEVQPSVRGMWTITPRHAFWAAVTRAVRTPSRIEEDVHLFGFALAVPPIYAEIDGNRDLNSERLIGYEAGYRALIRPDLYLDIAFFHNDYNDLIGLGDPTVSIDPTPAPPHYSVHFPWVNGAEGNTDGIEIAPDWKPTSWFQFKAAYSYLNLDLQLKPGFPDNQAVSLHEGSSPHNQVALETRFNIPHGFEFDQAYRYVSALPAQSIEGYHTADVRFAWNATRQLQFSLAGDNLLQPQHEEFGRDPGPQVGIRRAIYASITWRHGEN